MADETKLRFAQALRDIMNEKPLDKISVIEIAQRAGVSRKAFYNHFTDKYDLINWYCYSQFVVIHNEVLEGGWGAFKSFLEFFATDRIFFAEALRDMGQNSFGQTSRTCSSRSCTTPLTRGSRVRWEMTSG